MTHLDDIDNYLFYMEWEEDLLRELNEELHDKTVGTDSAGLEFKSILS